MCPPSRSSHGATGAAAVTSPAASAPASLCAPALSSPTPARRAFCPNPNFPSPGLWALGPGVALVPLAAPGEIGLPSAGLPPGSATGGPSAQILRMRDTLLPRCTSHLIDPGCCLGHRAPIRLQWKTDGLCSRAKSGG